MSSFNAFTATKSFEYHFSSKYVDVGCGHEPSFTFIYGSRVRCYEANAS